MFNKILTILSSACKFVAGLVQWKRKKRRQAISDAVHSGDVDEVTKHHHNLLRAILIILFVSFGMTGCVTETLYVNQPMTPIRMEHNGIPGWWLSDCLYEATLLKLDSLQNKD